MGFIIMYNYKIIYKINELFRIAIKSFLLRYNVHFIP
jgi:hypothetical protein